MGELLEHYEVIYEDGSHSIAYGTQEDIVNAVKEQHRRAVNGEPGGPAGHPAARVVRVLKYGQDHPGEFNPAGITDVKSIEAVAKEVAVQGLVSINEFVAALHEKLVYSMVSSAAHESNYRMEETEELEASLWQ